MELLLKKQELLDLGKGLHGVIIKCCDGQCWVTVTGDSRDHVLRKGRHLEVRTGGQVIITATQSCRILLKTSKQPERLEKKRSHKWLKGLALEGL